MKKSIKTTMLTLLSVGMLAGCNQGGGGSPAKPEESKWGKQLSAMMEIVAGEELPFIQLKAETFYSGFSATPEGGYFYVGDDNETNLLENYGDLLTAKGYEAVTEEDETYYLKEDENAYSIVAGFDFYEATEDYDAGNEIYVEAMNNAFDETVFYNDWFSKFFIALGVDVGELPAYTIASEDKSWEYDDSLFSWFGYEFAYANYSTQEEVDAFKTALLAKGWVVETEETYYADEEETIVDSTDYLFRFDGSDGYDAYISTTNYTDEQCVGLAFFAERHKERSSTLPVNSIKAFFASQGVANVTVPNFAVASADAEFALTDYSDDEDVPYLYVELSGATRDEMDAFAEALDADDWDVKQDDYGDYIATFGDGDLLPTITISDYLDGYGTIDLYFYVAEAEEISAEAVATYMNELFAYYGYSLELEWDDEYEEWFLAVRVGTGEDESEETLAGAAEILASYLPDYMQLFNATYGDPTAEGYVDLFGDGSYYYRATFVDESFSVVADIVSYVYNGSLIAAISVYDLAY